MSVCEETTEVSKSWISPSSCHSQVGQGTRRTDVEKRTRSDRVSEGAIELSQARASQRLEMGPARVAS